MKIQLSEVDYNLINRVCSLLNQETGIDDFNYIEVDTILAILDDLESKYKELEWDYEEYKEKIEDNYKPCDVNDNWRYYANTIEKLQNEIDKQHNFIKEKGLDEEYGRR